jgi:hypothetical protein
MWQHEKSAFFKNSTRRHPLVKPVRVQKPVLIPRLPEVEQSDTLTEAIYQVYVNDHPQNPLPQEIVDSRNRMQARNPNATMKLFDMDGMRASILHDYGKDILERFDSIDNDYIATKVDFFRYLHVYMHGGVYLDSKSELTKPIKEILSGKERYVLAQWRNGPEDEHPGFGVSPELDDVIPNGEFQQWHIIATKGHPLLRQAIKEILANIEIYRPDLHGVGKWGTLRIAGPIAYTLALRGILNQEEHHYKVVDPITFGLVFSVFSGSAHEKAYGKRHYSTLRTPIIKRKRARKTLSKLLPIPNDGARLFPPPDYSYLENNGIKYIYSLPRLSQASTLIA